MGCSKSICISSCKIFINLHIQNLLFLFYILIFTKHPHQFIYSTHLFNKIFIFFPILISLTKPRHPTQPPSNNEIEPIDQTTRSMMKHCDGSNPLIEPIDRRWSTVKLDREIEPIDQTTRSMVMDQTHWLNPLIDGEALWSLTERSNPLIKQRDRRWS